MYASYVSGYLTPGDPTGIIGNTLALLVIVRRRGPSLSSFDVYIAVLAASDTGSLLTWCYRYYVMMLADRLERARTGVRGHRVLTSLGLIWRGDSNTRVRLLRGLCALVNYILLIYMFHVVIQYL